MQRAALSLREDPVRSNPAMRTIEEIRRLRLEELRQEVEHLGGLAEINRRRGTNPRSAQLHREPADKFHRTISQPPPASSRNS